MVEENPFLHIIPREGEKAVGLEVDKIKKLLRSVVKENAIIVISGEYGSGKSLVVYAISKSLPKKIIKHNFVFGIDLLGELKGIPIETVEKGKIVVFIDKFDLIEAFNDVKALELLDIISELTRAGVSFVIPTSAETYSRLSELSDEFRGIATVYHVPALTLEETKTLVIERLNEVRKKSDRLFPFSEREIHKIWKTSHGNPRMILMICASLYEIKMRS